VIHFQLLLRGFSDKFGSAARRNAPAGSCPKLPAMPHQKEPLHLRARARSGQGFFVFVCSSSSPGTCSWTVAHPSWRWPVVVITITIISSTPSLTTFLAPCIERTTQRESVGYLDRLVTYMPVAITPGGGPPDGR
jgi:hypothetical protein